VLKLKLPWGISKLWVGGFYKTTYYAIQLKKEKAVTIATPHLMVLMLPLRNKTPSSRDILTNTDCYGELYA
jgi:hypothetical protein